MKLNNLCWICQLKEANSDEHLFKKSLIKHIWGQRLNTIDITKSVNFGESKSVQSIGSKEFTVQNIICTTCNNITTSNHDRAFHEFSTRLLSYIPLSLDINSVDLSQMFSKNTKQNLIWTQLYFVKVFGCCIKNHIRQKQNKEKFKFKKLALSILNNKPCSKIWISFGHHTLDIKNELSLKSSKLSCEFYNGGKYIKQANWLFTFGKLVFAVKFSELNNNHQAWWNPNSTSNIVPFIGFTDIVLKETCNTRIPI
ncbi:hypothetical protein MNBD_GAMMA02-1394 [hydrothermal vent metagenome]|uniref:Uncharacterized protein n=1 Tax=hydrothermal vent metagenome TaxID=652676 RepID=A0A3B0VZ67_9ZZZZ